MPSDISRLIFDKEKHYSGVRMQQGRVLLDSDWNAMHDIYQYRKRTQTKDVVGLCGFPKGTDSFKISASGGTFNLGKGRAYVNGNLYELNEDALYEDQPYYPNPEYLVDSDDDASELVDGDYLVYLEGKVRELTYLDDPKIKEVALGEADTTARLQNVWQAKLMQVPKGTTCESEIGEWDELLNPGLGLMGVQPVEGTSPSSPCSLQETGGYRGLENQLYRIEVQKGGNRSEARFKWSRDNASEMTIITQRNNNKIIVESLGRDNILGFQVGNWVEIVDDNSELNEEKYDLVKIENIDRAKLEITLHNWTGPAVFKPGMKIRKWDQLKDSVPPIGEEGLTMEGGNWIALEDGIEVNFSPGNFRAGDYWLVPARILTAQVEWESSRPPHGIQKSYCKIGIISVVGNSVVSVSDCRSLFKPLTEIDCDDDCCTIHVSPGPNWAEKLRIQLVNFKDAKICFGIGEYELDRPFVISDKGHLVLSGSGAGTRIISKNHETALVFQKCSSVNFRDFYLEGTINPKDSYKKHLNGTLTCLECDQVDISNSTFKTGIGSMRASTCITVRNDNHLEPVRVRIQNCELYIGHMQQGILLVNAIKVLVESNNISSYKRPDTISYPSLVVEDPKMKKDVMTWFTTGSDFDSLIKKEDAVSRSIVELVAEDETSKKAKKLNTVFINDNKKLIKSVDYPFDIKTNKDVEKFKLYAFDFAMANIGKFKSLKGALEYLGNQVNDVGAIGITVAGKIAEDVKIINNNIVNVLEGVHVGLSHENESKEPYIADRIEICRNSITNLLPPFINGFERFGIFVGNSYNLNVCDNNITLHRIFDYNKNTAGSNTVYIEGIRVWGEMGLRMKISDNTISGAPDKSTKPWVNKPSASYDRAILIQTTQTSKPKNYRWRIHDNVAIAGLSPNIFVDASLIKLNDDSSGKADDNIG